MLNRHRAMVSTFTKLAINRKEITHLSLFSCIYVDTDYFYTC